MLSAYLLKYSGARGRAIFQEREKVMTRTSARRGFTLVEMLVVIAIIAVLVAILIPTVTAATTKAKAGTDAANLRSQLGEADILLLHDSTDAELQAELASYVQPCKSQPGAAVKLVHDFPGFVDIYYVKGSTYYGIDYFSAMSLTGKPPEGFDGQAHLPEGYTNPVWITLGGED